MSKGGPIIALGVAAPCTVVGAFYLAKSTNIDATLPEKLEDFKKKDGGDCVQALFSGVDKMENSSATAASSSDKVNGDLFKDQTTTPEGCLVINGKKESKDDKGKGNFRFLWAMKRGSQGFITFTKATVPKEEGNNDQIKGEGVAYTTKLTEGTGGDIEKKKEVTSKDMPKTDAKTKFPIKGESISDISENSSFGFMNPSSDTDKICGKDDCNGSATSKEHLQGYWKWTSSTDSKAKTADKWSKNLDAGGNDLYTKTEWDMQEVVKEVKGSGTKVLTNSNPTTTSTVSK